MPGTKSPSMKHAHHTGCGDGETQRRVKEANESREGLRPCGEGDQEGASRGLGSSGVEAWKRTATSSDFLAHSTPIRCAAPLIRARRSLAPRGAHHSLPP